MEDQELRDIAAQIAEHVSDDELKIIGEIHHAIQFFRSDETRPPDWTPNQWITALMVKLGQAAQVAYHESEEQDVDLARAYRLNCADQLIAIAAASQEAVLSLRA